MTTITLTDKTSEKFNSTELEAFINSWDFEDIILWYQMMKWKTWKTQTYCSFKQELWL